MDSAVRQRKIMHEHDARHECITAGVGAMLWTDITELVLARINRRSALALRQRLVFMLKIWKQTWKKDDSTRRSKTNGEVEAQDASQSGTGTDVSSQNTLSAAPPNSGDIDLGSVLPRGRRGAAKRARVDDSTDPNRPPKKRKGTSTEADAFDTLGNHLPELIRAESNVRSDTSVPKATFEDDVLDQAKNLNSEFHHCSSYPLR